MSGAGGGGGNPKTTTTCCGRCCGVVLTAGFVVLVYWAVFQPHQIRAAVDSAALSNLTVVVVHPANASARVSVSYHLAVSLRLYNPSKRVGVYYDALDAAAELRIRDTTGAVIGPAAAGAASPSAFFQKRKSGDVVRLEFDGKGVDVADDDDDGGGGGLLRLENKGEAVKGEAPAVVASLQLDVDARVRYAFGYVVKVRQRPRIRCRVVSVPVGGGAAAVLSSGDRWCRVKY